MAVVGLMHLDLVSKLVDQYKHLKHTTTDSDE
jgi:hypothetical protein